MRVDAIHGRRLPLISGRAARTRRPIFRTGAMLAVVVAAQCGSETSSDPGVSSIDPVGGPEAYANTAALMGDCVRFKCADTKLVDGGGAGAGVAIELDATVAPPIPGATRSMRYDFTHGGDGCTSPEIRRAIGFPAQQEVWAEFYVRWSSNFRTTNTRCEPNDHKLIFGDTQADLSYRWGFHVGGDTGPGHTVGWDYPLGDGFPGRPYLSQVRAGHDLPASALWDGRWHVIRFHIRSSRPGSTASCGTTSGV
jgi:hypothetical protein